ncbi:MAG TPA: VTT domain-containing protein [Candidatus Eisenbacteria bacterium]
MSPGLGGSAPPRRPAWGAIVLSSLAVAAIVAFGFWLAPHVTRARVETWVRGAGAWGPVVILAVQAAQILVAPVPGVFVPLLAGALYGPVVGALVTAVGTLLGSTAAYWIGRAAGRPMAERWIGPAAVEKAHALLRGRRWLALVPLFLFPFSPSDAICFAAGILAVPWAPYTLAVLLGRVPKDVVLAVGAALGRHAFFVGS